MDTITVVPFNYNIDSLSDYPDRPSVNEGKAENDSEGNILKGKGFELDIQENWANICKILPWIANGKQTRDLSKMAFVIEAGKGNSTVRSGSIFIYTEAASGIKKWTDRLIWSPSHGSGEELQGKRRNS